jgi:hypothetical protein
MNCERLASSSNLRGYFVAQVLPQENQKWPLFKGFVFWKRAGQFHRALLTLKSDAHFGISKTNLTFSKLTIITRLPQPSKPTPWQSPGLQETNLTGSQA